jgi:hypothetical protein
MSTPNWLAMCLIGVILVLCLAFPSKKRHRQEAAKRADLGREPRRPEDVFRYPPVVSASDRLVTMWEQQRQFMLLLQEKRGFPSFPTDISSKKGQQFLNDIRHHLQDELHEAAQHLKNAKSHRATEVPEVDREAYKEELVDALHLYLELVIASGISLDELHAAYMDKGEVNRRRIESGY